MSLYVARSSAIAARSLGSEMIVMSISDSTLFTLNEVARDIWQSANGQKPLADIVRDSVCANFDVDPDVAYSDAESFCRKLAEHGILLLSDQPIPAGR